METESTNEKLDAPYEVEEIITRKGYGTDMNYKHEYVWERILVHVSLQLGWVIGFYTLLFYAQWKTIAFAYILGFFIAQAVSLGAHRYYSHKSYKATVPLQIALLVLQCMAGQNSMYTWARDHKLHHKYSDTDADPHNSSRGFFFCHMGWLLVKRHPLLLKKQHELDVTEFHQDKLLMFQYKYFLHMYFILAMILPVSVPIYFWNETLWNSFFVVYCFQYVSNLHITWTINSFAHLWGPRPYDRRIKAVQSWFSWMVTFGEGWHNFHHAFPWDSRLSEFGQMGGLTTALLEILRCLGLAYELKTAAPSIVYGHMKRHGDEVGQKILREKIGLEREREETRVI